ncbi:hypothetical protein V5O48_005522 [Marasmius crinis-equi]|uniref:Zn(2)-C6 fungal-type domain-containing protein n=1 Tax=Marasmius crinis-equi TaxID=585013 RepID=A0ABR3FMI6_9AGAR
MASTSANNDARPKRKRLAKACDACHKSKRRCDGLLPCANCFYASKACTYTDNNGRPVPAPRAMPEQPPHPQHSPQQPPQLPPQPYYPIATKRARQEGPSNVSQSQPVEIRARVPMDLDASLTRELINLFFTHCHPIVATIHKPSFTNALSLKQVSPYLVFAICALSARFSKQPSLHATPDRFSGRAFADEAERLMFEDEDAVGSLIVIPTLQVAQALNILSIYEILSTTHKPDTDAQPGTSAKSKGKEPEKPPLAQWARGERYRDLALHIVHTLGAHLPDQPLLTPVPSQAFIETSIERESIRRVFWFIYTVDLLRGTYYRWEAQKKGGSGSGYAGSGISLDSVQLNAGLDLSTSGFNGPAATPRQPSSNFSVTTSSLADALGLTEGVMGFSEAELKLRLPTDETSFELGTIHESLPEYLHLPPICTPHASELGHVIRVMTIHQKVEQCLGDVVKINKERSCSSVSHPPAPFDPPASSRTSHPHPHLPNTADPSHHHARQPSGFPFPAPPPLDYRQNQRRQAATHRLFECERVLNEWSESLPQQLRFTETNLHIHKSMFETSSNSSAWCFACMHTVFASCSLALAVGFRGIPVDSSRGQSEGGDQRKPGERSKDRNDLAWAVERLHIILDFMGERAKFSMILGSVIWPLMRYVHQDDAQMKAWDDMYEDYTGVRMGDLTGGKWEEEPILGPRGRDISAKNCAQLYPPSDPQSASTPMMSINGPNVPIPMSVSEPLMGHPLTDPNMGIAPSLVSNPPPSSQPIPAAASSSQPQSFVAPSSTSLPSLKSSGLLEWRQGSLSSHAPVPVPVPVPGSQPPPPQSQSQAAPPSSSSSPAPENGQARSGLSWMMNG